MYLKDSARNIRLAIKVGVFISTLLSCGTVFAGQYRLAYLWNIPSIVNWAGTKPDGTKIKPDARGTEKVEFSYFADDVRGWILGGGYAREVTTYSMGIPFESGDFESQNSYPFIRIGYLNVAGSAAQGLNMELAGILGLGTFHFRRSIPGKPVEKQENVPVVGVEARLSYPWRVDVCGCNLDFMIGAGASESFPRNISYDGRTHEALDFVLSRATLYFSLGLGIKY